MHETLPEYNGWTLTAIECYKSGCICEMCYIPLRYKTLRGKCQMKYAVLQLVRKFGIPDEKIERRLRINAGIEKSGRRKDG